MCSSVEDAPVDIRCNVVFGWGVFRRVTDLSLEREAPLDSQLGCTVYRCVSVTDGPGTVTASVGRISERSRVALKTGPGCPRCVVNQKTRVYPFRLRL